MTTVIRSPYDSEPWINHHKISRRREMKTTSFARVSMLGILAAGFLQGASAQTQDQRKDATSATKQANSALLSQLPFSDNSDFNDANRGLLAPLPSELIKGSAGNAIWNPQQYSF